MPTATGRCATAASSAASELVGSAAKPVTLEIGATSASWHVYVLPR